MMSSRYDVINEISIYVDDHRWVCYELSCIMWIKCACVLYMNEFIRDTNSNLNEDDVTRRHTLWRHGALTCVT